MKISATFENEDEALEAIHAGYAWTTLREINDVLRQNKKYDLPCEEAVSQIQASITDALSLLYPG